MVFKRKTRTRVVTLRLSQEEFRDFRNIGIDEGFGSLSELLRGAVQELIAKRKASSPEALHAAMERLNTRMEELGRDIKQLRTSSTGVTG